MLFIAKVLQLQTCLLIFFGPVASDPFTQEMISITPAFPETNHTARISCYSIEDRIWFHNGTYKTTCNKEQCIPSKDSSRRYAYTAEKDKTEVTISSANRALDGGVWTCEGKRKNNVTLDVYSFPRGLSLTIGGKSEVDLARSQVTLQCQTDGCTYPIPKIKWYYKDVTKLASPTSYKENGTHQMRNDGVCISPEQMYTSNLTLPLHTTWQDNSNKAVTFSCGTDYFNSSRKILSTESKKITFAVGVSQVKMQLKNKALSGMPYLYVTSGIPITLTCVPGLSRPDPTIEWFIGSRMISSGTSQTFTFIPKNADNDNVIFCRAYNINRNGAVESEKTKLYVTVHVTEVKLQFNSQPVSEQSLMTVASGETVTLTCAPGISRPDPTIEWYIGSLMKGASTSHTYAFTADNEDHGKMIYCRAYNVDPDKAVESSKGALYVKGPPHPVLRFYLNSMKKDQIELHFVPGFNGGHDQSFAIEYLSILIPGSTWESTGINDLQETEKQYRFPNGTFFVNITLPSPGLYLYRMYSWNVKGRSSFSDSIHITIPSVTEGETNPGEELVTTMPVFVGMGAGTAVLIVTVIALVILILRKRSYVKTSEENEVPRYEVVQVIPTQMSNRIPTEYDSLREDDNPYQEMQDISANGEINLRLESGRLILQSAENDITCNVYDSPTSSKGEVYSYVEPQEVIRERANARPKIGRVILPVPLSNVTFKENDDPRCNKAEVHSYLEVQGRTAGYGEKTKLEVGRVILQSPVKTATYDEYEKPKRCQNDHSYIEPQS